MKLHEHEAVIEIIDDSTIRLRPTANASFFGKLYRSNKYTHGNISTFDNGDLKINLSLGSAPLPVDE